MSGAAAHSTASTPATRPRVAVLGAGSWGTALAALSARNGNPTVLWGRDRAQVAAMRESRRNPRYFPDLELPAGLAYSAELDEALHDAALVLVVVPSHAFTDLLQQVAAVRPGLPSLSWATKGFEAGSGRFLHEVVADLLGPTVRTAVVTGPSFAREVVQGLPTAVTVHSADAEFANAVAAALHAPRFRAYTGSDILGAELGGAMKNVLAVATGVSDGMQFGLNARAGVITRGLHEMLRLNAALGGRAETLMGLAGLGDLVLTCTGDLSRNRRLGLALGRGVPLEEAVAAIGQVVESLQTADEVMRLATRHGIELPISALVQRVLRGELSATEGVAALLSREQKPEYVASLS